MIKLGTICAETTIGFKQKQKNENWIKSRASDNIITRRNTKKKKKKLKEAKSQRLKIDYQHEYS